MAEERSSRWYRLSLQEVVVLAILLLFLASMFWPLSKYPGKVGLKAARAHIAALSVALERYYLEFQAYPPDEIGPAGGSAEYEMSEVLVHYLGRTLTVRGRQFGPYIALESLRDVDDDGFDECLDRFGTPYLYANNQSHETPTGANEEAYDLVSAGPDGALGGSMTPQTGYVPATTAAGKAQEEDNITYRPR